MARYLIRKNAAESGTFRAPKVGHFQVPLTGRACCTRSTRVTLGSRRPGRPGRAGNTGRPRRSPFSGWSSRSGAPRDQSCHQT